MNTRLTSGAPVRRGPQAFSLLEVMVAIGIFFMGVFAILGLVSSSLENARRWQRPAVDAGLVASALTNCVEGTVSGKLSDFLGKAYQDYSYTVDTIMAMTNGLYESNIILHDDAHDRAVVSRMVILRYDPQSAAGGQNRGLRR